MSSARSSRRTGGGGGPSSSSRRSKSPGMLPGEQPGLRGLVQTRLLNDVFQKASEKWDGWKILIVDDHAMRVISAAVGMYDIMEKKITLVESLDKKRAPFPDMGAVYLVEPSQESVSKILQDFTEKPLYGNAVFLYFLGRLPDELLNQIKQCRPLLRRVKCLSEINVDFLAKEERAFTLDMRESFKSFYLRNDATPAERIIADKLVTVCATLNEYPHIRFRQSSAVCSSLSAIFHLKMDAFVASNPSWWYHGGPQKSQAARRERGTLLLLDRADDCLTPIMHDFHYQSMVRDLLTMEGDRITFQNDKSDGTAQTEAKDALLDEKDSVWVDLRGKHIAAVIENLSARIREIMNSSSGNAFGGKKSGNMSLSEMASALKALPEYREVMSKLSQHMHLAHECMDVLGREGLMELSEFEQTVATGKDEDGRSPSLSDMVDTCERLLMKMKDPKDRLRIILVFTVSQGGLRQQDRRRLMNAAELTRADMKTLNSLEILGLSTLASADKNRLVSMFKGGGGASDVESEYAASRYVPALKATLEDLARNCLSLEEFPSVMPMPDQGQSGSNSSRSARNSAASARSSRRGEAGSVRKSAGATSRWSKSTGTEGKRSAGPVNLSGGRCMVFMVGGLSFSELKVARDVMSNESREVIIGSTAFLAPRDFLEDLTILGLEEEI